jgi:hypothetical protein
MTQPDGKGMTNMVKFERFVVSAAAGTLVALASMWASAAPADVAEIPADLAQAELCNGEAERAYDAALILENGERREDDQPLADAAWEDSYHDCMAVVDVDSFVYASRNVSGAPVFCAATFIELAPNGSYRAVCVLEGAL